MVDGRIRSALHRKKGLNDPLTGWRSPEQLPLPPFDSGLEIKYHHPAYIFCMSARSLMQLVRHQSDSVQLGSEFLSATPCSIERWRNIARKALDDGEVSQDAYLQRPYKFSALPTWLQAECYQIAREHYGSIRNDRVAEFLGDSVVTAFSRNALLMAPIMRQLGMGDPWNLISKIRRSLAKHATQIRPRFNDSAFRQLGLDDADTLSVLLAGKNPVVEPRPTLPPESIIELYQNGVRSSQPWSYKFVHRLNDLIRFSPNQRTDVGAAARRAYSEIADITFAYTLLSDILQANCIELTPPRMLVLIRQIQPDPFNLIPRTSQINSLALFAQFFDGHEKPLKHISRHEAFNEYAFRDFSIDDLRREDLLFEEFHKRSQEPSPAPASSLRTQLTTLPELHYSKTEMALRDIVISSTSREPRLHRAAVNLCLRRGIEPEQLESLIAKHNGDLLEVIQLLRSRGKLPRGGRQKVPERNNRVDATRPHSGSEAVLRTFEIYLHPDASKRSFIHWLESLDKAARTRLEALIASLERGNLGAVRSISQRSFGDDNVSIFELRCHYSPGYRIYFHFLPGHRVVLLCGGDKDTQQRDIKVAFELGRLYNGIHASDDITLPRYN